MDKERTKEEEDDLGDEEATFPLSISLSLSLSLSFSLSLLP